MLDIALHCIYIISMIKHERKNHTMGIRVDNKTLRNLEVMAQKEKRTVSDLVRIWIAERLEKESKLKKAG